MRVLVTGGAGFIGSHVVDRLQARGIEPRIFDLVPSPHHRPGDVETVLGDLCDRDAVLEALEGCDAIVHLAALADVDEVTKDPARADRVNVRGTQTLLDGGARARDRPLRLREHDLGLRRRSRAGGRRRGHAARAAEALLHRHEDRRRDVHVGLHGALRARAHDPPLRHPVRPALATDRGGRRLHRQGARGPAADDRGRRHAVAALRLCGGPRRRRRRLARPGRRQPRLQPRRPREHERPLDRAHRPRRRRRRSDRPHRRTGRRSQGRQHLGRARGARARLGAHDVVRRRRPALRRLGDRRGRDAREWRPPRARTAAQRPSCAKSPPSCRRPSRAAARRRPHAARASHAARSTAASRAAPSRGPTSTRGAAANRAPAHERVRRS